MFKDLTVLMTAAGSPSMPGISGCLKGISERNIHIIGTDMNIDSTITQYMDECIQVPSAKDDNYIDTLLNICEMKNVDILIPSISEELPILCEKKEKFESIGTKVSISNSKSINICVNKLSFYNFLKSNGIYTPKYFSINSLQDFDLFSEKIGYPKKAFVLKITTGSGSRGIRIVDPMKSYRDILLNDKPNSLFTSFENLRSILSLIGDFPQMMMMEYIPGKEYSVDLLADHGEVLYICGRDSTCVKASIPMEAMLEENKEAYEFASKIVKLLKIDGNADFDFKFDQEGHPILMEVNPRIAATMSVFAAGGLNLLYLRIKHLLNEHLPENIKIKYGTRMKRRYLEQIE